MSHSLRVVLRHEGRDYAYDAPFPLDDEPEDAVAAAAVSQYTKGNYACDCNRSLFINRYCDDAPDEWAGADEEGVLPCGDTIELVSLVYVGEGGTERMLWPEPEDGMAALRARATAAGLVLPW